MASQHWGEFHEPQNELIPDVTAEILRSMDKCCLNEFEDDCDKDEVEEIMLPPIDPLVLYTISLQKYANNMIEMIRVAELAIETNVIPPEDATPMPVMPEKEYVHKKNDLNYIPKDFTPFSLGLDAEYPELSEVIARNFLSKAIATLFVHIGFETTHQSVLDLLVDVVEDFYRKICHKIVDAIEEEDKGNVSGFPNVVEKVLTETGLGGMKGLDDYYQNRVVKYVGVMQKRCKELNDHYANLLIPRNCLMTDGFNGIKQEHHEIIEVCNPDVYFTTFDADTPVLESALQLLNRLEAEESLQNLEQI